MKLEVCLRQRSQNALEMLARHCYAECFWPLHSISLLPLSTSHQNPPQIKRSECWQERRGVALVLTRCCISNKRAIEIYANPRLRLCSRPTARSSRIFPERFGHFWGIMRGVRRWSGEPRAALHTHTPPSADSEHTKGHVFNLDWCTVSNAEDSGNPD